MRVFVGIPLPNDVRASLHMLQRALIESGADVNWVAPEHLHVTLKFFGELSEAHVDAAKMWLARVAGRQLPFTMSLAEIGAFPSLDAPRVVWVGVAEGAEAAARLAGLIEQEGVALGLQKEERPFAAHVTLGRLRSPRHRQALVQRLRASSWQPPHPWQAASLTLYHSVLTPAGPHYTALADLPLTGSRAASAASGVASPGRSAPPGP